jgi:hypothetical protein
MRMLGSIFDTFRGLPTHILIVHAVVVLVPLCFVGVLVAAFSRTWRQRLATPILVLLAVGLIASFIATRSGYQLRRRIGATPSINHHQHIAVWVPWFVLIAFVLTAGWLALEQRAGAISLRGGADAEVLAAPVRSEPSPGVRLTACVLAVASCAFASGWIAYAGEAGSKSVWHQVVISTNNKK